MSGRTRVRRLLSRVAIVGLVSACAKAPSPSGEVAAAPAVVTPCAVPVPGVSEPWNQVTTPRITLCLPPGWRQVNARTWRGQGTITLNIGSPRRVPFTIGAVTGSGAPSPTGPSPRRSTESIGGRMAEILVLGGSRGYTVYVSWAAPQMQLTGEAASSSIVDLHLAIIRTVRFAP